jgi:ParB-like chromosome segregation protein Spo0J
VELEPRTRVPAHATGAVEFVPLAQIADDAAFRLREEGDVSALAASIGRLGQLVPIELRPVPGAAGGAPRWQVMAGFRRIAALRLLMRDRVLARLHGPLEDEDAWGIALVEGLLREPLDEPALATLREHLALTDAAPWADELVDEALVRAPVAPELRERFLEFLGGPPAAAEPKGARAGEAGGVEVAAPDDAGGGGLEPAAAEAEAPMDAEAPTEVEVTPDELAEDLSVRLYAINEDLAVAFESWKDLPPEGRRAILDQVRWLADLLPHLEREEG